MAKTVVIVVIFFLGFWYVAFPIHLNLRSFPLLPQSEQVKEEQSKAVYYTDQRRQFVTAYYENLYQKLHCPAFELINPYCYIRPLKLNHSPNLATIYIQSDQKSTYLEEYFYPLRSSLVLSGYEPFNEEGKAFNKKSMPLIYFDKQYDSEVTARYVSSSITGRIFVYILILVCIYWEIVMFKRLRNKRIKLR